MMGGQVTPEGKEYNMDVDVQWKSFVAFKFDGNLKKKKVSKHKNKCWTKRLLLLVSITVKQFNIIQEPDTKKQEADKWSIFFIGKKKFVWFLHIQILTPAVCN